LGRAEQGFRTDFTYITPDHGENCVDRGVCLVGIDYLSIEKSGSPGHPVHVTLLEKEVVIVEGLDLREVPAGDYALFCLPLKYDGGTGDGAPARTIFKGNVNYEGIYCSCVSIFVFYPCIVAISCEPAASNATAAIDSIRVEVEGGKSLQLRAADLARLPQREVKAKQDHGPAKDATLIRELICVWLVETRRC
jgi:hypothetical protein